MTGATEDPGASAVAPQRKRGRLVLGAAGLALATLVGAAWTFRLPLADAAVRDAFRRAGIDADFNLARADFGGAALTNLRVGPETAPDAAAARAEARIGWGLTGPRLAGVRLREPALRVRIDGDGISLGQLDRLLTQGRAGGEARLPDMAVDITGGHALLLTPAGAIPVTFSSSGRLTRDFAGVAEIAPVTRSDAGAIIANLRGAGRARTENRALILELDGAVDALRAAGFDGKALRITGRAAIPREITGAEGVFNGSGQTMALGGIAATGLQLDAKLATAADRQWRLGAGLKAAAASGPAGALQAAEVSLSAVGDLRQAHGEWSVRSADNALGGLSAPEAAASGAYTFDGRAADGAVIAATGRITLATAGMDAAARARVTGAIPAMAGSPVAPLIGSGKAALDRALTRFSAAAAIRLDWRGGAGRIAAPGPFVAEAASGARITVSPIEAGRPALMALLPSGAIESGARIVVEGGDMPPATLALDRFSLQAGKLAAAGALTIEDWRAAGGRLDLQRTTFALARDGDAGTLSLDGALSLDGRTEAMSVADFRSPLKLEAAWGGGFRVTLPDRCIPATVGALGIPGHLFGARAISLCAGTDKVLVAADSAGRLSGGFAVDRLALSGRTADASSKPVTLAADRIVGRFTGPRSDNHLQLEAAAPRYAIDFAPDRRIRFSGDVVTARTAPRGRVTGAFRGGMLEDPALPANVARIDARWTAGPEGDRTVVRIAEGQARVTDKFTIPVAEGSTDATDPAAKPRPRFNPLRITGISGALADGRIDADGAILLEDKDREIARFTARHDLASGDGSARVTNPTLQFSSALDLYEITELARGVVHGVEGPVGVDLTVDWDSATLTSRGRISPRQVNLLAVALGPAEGISGDIDFDDLFALTTPPGQRVAIHRLNPGVMVEDGEIAFQVLGPDRVQIEGAAWPFASGELSIAPQLVVIGEDEFRMNLTLRDVDVQKLLDQLAIQDLAATGRVEGAFPLVFDERGGRIVKGLLRAAPPGGEIRYTGSAGAGLVGAPQIAFDALKSFAYTDLVLELDGALDGEIFTAIRFSGQNVQPIGGIMAPGVIPLPGMDRLKVTGWPFAFTVSVRAPFRRLARTSDSINDARPLVEEAIRGAPEAPPAPPPAVDQPQPAPR